MQVKRGLFQIAMTEQQLDGAQVGSRFQQVGSEAVTQGVLIMLMISFPPRSVIAIIRATDQRSTLFDT